MIDHVTIEGGDSIHKILIGLEAKASRAIVASSLRTGARVVQAAAKRLAPRDTGALERSIKVRSGRARHGVSVVVGVGQKWFTGDQFYGAFQEFGWKTGKRKSKNRKQVPGEHFMEYAFDEKAAQATQAVIDDARKRIRQVSGVT